MKTLIVGAGIIGVIYGWALAQAGVDVTHFVRKGKKAQFENGVSLDLLDERRGHPKYNVTKYALKCVDEVSPSDGYELIIVPINSQQAEEALTTLVPVWGNASFLMFTSNWEGTGSIDRLLPKNRYLLGYPDGGGTVREGVYWTNLGSEVHLGLVEGNSIELLNKVKALFVRADMKPDMQDNILHWLWMHNASATGYAAGFAKHGEMQAYLGDEALMRLCTHSTKEMCELCKRRGVDLGKYPEIGFINFPVWLVVSLLRRNFKRNESMQRFTAHAASQGSLQETKANYISMLKTADELGLPMPYTKAVGTYLQSV